VASSPALTRRQVVTFGATFVSAGYFGLGAAMWGWQELLIFPAPTLDATVLDQLAARTGAKTLELESGDGTQLYGWHRPANGERAVLFFHGNAETVADRVPLQDFLVEQGWDVVVIAYRGYPGSDGTPSEEGLALDARAAWDFVTGAQGLDVPPSRVVIHGKSLGGGVSALLAEQVQPAGLVMESTFLSIAEVAKARFPLYPVDQLLKHPFDTKSRAPNIACPTLVMHADRDQTIPVSHGRALAKLFPDARYVEVEGLGHGETLPLADPQARSAYLGLLGQVTAPIGTP
jgi:pimeloyl-ACP methyl ester carboxylesterase